MNDLASLFDHVTVIDAGHMRFDGSLLEFLAHGRRGARRAESALLGGPRQAGMRALAFLRSSCGVRLLPIVLVLGALIMRAPLMSEQTAVGTSGRRLTLFMLMGGPVAMAAVLEARRYRSRGFLSLPSARPKLSILGPAVGAVVLPTMIVGVALVAVPRSGPMGVAVALVGVAWMATWALLGLTTRAVVAVPVGLLAPILAVAYAPALEVLWLRYVMGFYEDCCSISESLDHRAVVVGLLRAVSMEILCGAGIVLRLMKRWPAAALWLVTLWRLVLTLALVSPMASSLDARPRMTPESATLGALG